MSLFLHKPVCSSGFAPLLLSDCQQSVPAGSDPAEREAEISILGVRELGGSLTGYRLEPVNVVVWDLQFQKCSCAD